MTDLFKIKTNNLFSALENEGLIHHDYRTVRIDEIKPGLKCRLVGHYRNVDGESVEYYYNHTFPHGDCDNLEYNRRFMKIWKNKSPMTKVEYAHSIGDEVSHISDSTSYGKIKSQLWVPNNDPRTKYVIQENQNYYMVNWTKEPEGLAQSWYSERELSSITIPMKPEEIKSKTKKKKCIATFSFEEWNQEMYDNLVKEFRGRKDLVEAQLAGLLWSHLTGRILVGSHKNVMQAIKESLRGRTVRRIKIQRTDEWSKDRKPIYKPKRKVKHKKSHIRKSSVVTIPPQPNDGVPEIYRPGQLVCIKHVGTGVVARMKRSDAIDIVKRRGDKYMYCDKQEWRRYLKTREENKKANFEKTLFKTGKDPISGMEANRKMRRLDKQKVHRLSRLVKEQFVPKIIQEEKVTLIDHVPIFRYIKTGTETFKKVFFGEKDVKRKLVVPAYVKIKRILTSVQPKKLFKVTSAMKDERLARSQADKDKYNKSKGYKSLSELTDMFKKEERRNDRYSSTEKWSRSFDKLLTLVTSGVLLSDDQYPSAYQLNRKGVYVAIKQIIIDEHKLKWSEEKIDDFIRYLRLTNKGIFKPKEPKRKKRILPKVFEPSKWITKIDHSKMKYVTPDEDKNLVIKFKDELGELEADAVFREGDMYNRKKDFLCPFKDVISWRYEKDKEFTNALEIEEGAIKEIPIKFRWIPTESLKKFFDKNKLKNGK